MKIILVQLIALFFPIVLFSQTSDVRVNEAIALKMDKDYSGAMKILDDILEKNYKNALAHAIKGSVHFDQEKYQEAFNEYTIAVDMEPSNVYFRTDRGLFLLQIGEYELADEDFDYALDYADEDSLKCYVYNIVGAAKSFVREFDEAYLLLKESLNCDPDNLATLVTIAPTCMSLDKNDEAKSYIERALQLDSNNYMVLGNVGFMYQELGEYQTAIDCFEKALVLEPNEPQALGNLAYNQMKTKNLSVAMKNINKSIKLYPENAYSYRTRALIHLENGKKKKACEDLTMALDLEFSKLHGESALELQREHCR